MEKNESHVYEPQFGMLLMLFQWRFLMKTGIRWMINHTPSFCFLHGSSIDVQKTSVINNEGSKDSKCLLLSKYTAPLQTAT